MWSIFQGPKPAPLPGSDPISYAWIVENEEGEHRTVLVEISEMALASEGLPDPLPAIIWSKGATAVIGVAHWREPPEVVTVSTTRIHPFPGSPDPAIEAR